MRKRSASTVPAAKRPSPGTADELARLREPLPDGLARVGLSARSSGEPHEGQNRCPSSTKALQLGQGGTAGL